jgi:hypothetical protein
MKIKLTLIFLFIFLSLYSQKRHTFKKYAILGTSMMVSGMLDGTIETISHHYGNFKGVFPNANDKFWDPSISWKNKYKNNNYTMGPKYPGSTNFFVWTTDGYHLLRTSKRFVNFGTTAYYMDTEIYKSKEPNKLKFKKWLGDFIFISIVHSIGFTLCYDVVFRK